MAVKPTRRLFTVDEYYKLGCMGVLAPDERVELIEGEIIQMPPIGAGHASRVDRIVRLFTFACGESAQVRCQNPLYLSDLSEPVPDVMLLKPRVDFYATHHPTPFDVFLLVEVADTTLAYDTKTKLPLYAREGVPEVWIVDSKLEAVRVSKDHGSAGYRVSEIKRRGEHVTPTVFPDKSFSVDEILG